MNTNVDPGEVARFSELAARWWDADGEMRPLHEMNPLRVALIDSHARLAGKRVLDVGCGGGLLAEAMAQRGARVVAIDAAETPLAVARLHAIESGVEVDYRHSTAEAMAAGGEPPFDAVTCLELLEHVPDPASLVGACARLVRPGGWVFFSTVNRNPRAYLLAVLAAEYLLHLLPRGTHDYARFIRPSELDAWARASDLTLRALAGMRYNPFTRHCSLSDDVGVNYLAVFAAAEGEE